MMFMSSKHIILLKFSICSKFSINLSVYIEKIKVCNTENGNCLIKTYFIFSSLFILFFTSLKYRYIDTKIIMLVEYICTFST